MNALEFELTTPCSVDDLQLANNVLPFQTKSIALEDALQLCSELSQSAKQYWQYLYNHTDRDTRLVYYSARRMATRFNVDQKTIKRGIEQLVRGGWLRITEYSRSGGIDEVQVLMPQHVFNEIIQGQHRKEGPLNFENKYRHYLKAPDGTILITYYVNPNGTNVIIPNPKLDIEYLAKTLLQNILDGVRQTKPVEDIKPMQAAANSEPAKIHAKLTDEKLTLKNELKTKIKEMDEKIQADQLPVMANLTLVGQRNRVINRLEKLERVDTVVTTPINKDVNPKRTKGNTSLPHVNPSATKKQSFFAIAKESGKYVSIRYSSEFPITIPEKYVTKVKCALKIHRAAISDPAGLLKQILWAIARRFVGKPKDRLNATLDDIMRYNTDVAIKLIREKRWLTPSGFIPREVLEAEKKVEYAKEVRLRSRTGQQDYVNTASEAVSFKSMLEKSGRV